MLYAKFIILFPLLMRQRAYSYVKYVITVPRFLPIIFSKIRTFEKKKWLNIAHIFPIWFSTLIFFLWTSEYMTCQSSTQKLIRSYQSDMKYPTTFFTPGKSSQFGKYFDLHFNLMINILICIGLETRSYL